MKENINIVDFAANQLTTETPRLKGAFHPPKKRMENKQLIKIIWAYSAKKKGQIAWNYILHCSQILILILLLLSQKELY